MRNLVLIYAVLLAVSLIGCASTPMDKRRADTMDCMERFVKLEAHILDAGKECRAIYKKPQAREVSSEQ